MKNRRALGVFALCLGSLWGAAGLAQVRLPQSGVARITLLVEDMDRATSFYTRVLGFARTSDLDSGRNPLAHLFSPASIGSTTRLLAVGEQRVALVAARHKDGRGAPYPGDAHSNDLGFQHLALVVGDMDRVAHGLARHRVRAISMGGPQTIPPSNPAAGGIRAYYFRDPDGHPLELIWFPRGKGDPRWQDATSARVLGIDHTAIAVRDSKRSIAFYRDVAALTVRGESFNQGPEQEALSDVKGARVRITGLRGESGPGLELLEYEAPGNGRGAQHSTTAGDIADTETTLYVSSLDAALRAAEKHGAGIDPALGSSREGARAQRLRDPDGHALRLVQR
jgi:catechol 2,3-dioxygenase-like lactoylglutathione lyase family enzyme